MNQETQQPTVHVVAHSHFDPEWTRTYPQYLRIETRNLKQRLDLLQTDVRHRFSPPEELATLPFLQRCGARYRRAFRAAVLQQNVELKGCVAPGELTMHHGEGVARQFVLGKFLIERALNVRLDVPVAHSIDNYGMCTQLPQILRQCDRELLIVGTYRDGRYATLHVIEPDTGRHELWWEGPDGSRLLTVLSPYAGIGPEPTEEEMAEVIGGLLKRSGTRAAYVYSGGDFAPPDRALPRKIEQWSARNGYPPMKPSLPRKYYEAVRDDPTIPVGRTDSITDHLGVFESRVKSRQAARRAECALLTAEKFATAAAATVKDFDYPHEKLEDAWFHLLINQDHDPALACLRDSLMKCVFARHRRVQRLSAEILRTATRAIARNIDTRSATRPSWVVFNPLGWDRTDVVELPGRKRIIAEQVPSMGYKVVHDEGTESDFLYDVIPTADGSVHVRRAGESEDCAILAPMHIQADHGCPSVIRLGKRSRELRLVSQRVYDLSAVTRVCESHFAFRKSSIVQSVMVHRGVDRVEVRTRVMWRDKGFRVRASVPVSSPDAEFVCNEPFMVTQRDLNSPTVRKPVVYWAGWYDQTSQRGVAIANRGTHSYAIEDRMLHMTLFRSVDTSRMERDPRNRARDKDCGWCMMEYSNDMACELGRNEFHYALLPIRGSLESSRVHQRAYDFNHPLLAIPVSRHPGKLPAEHSFVRFSDDRAIFSTWKKSYRQPKLDILRVYEPYGGRINGLKIETSAGRFTAECNMDERVLHECRKPDGSVMLDVEPYTIRSLIRER